MKKLCNL